MLSFISFSFGRSRSDETLSLSFETPYVVSYGYTATASAISVRGLGKKIFRRSASPGADGPDQFRQQFFLLPPCQDRFRRGRRQFPRGQFHFVPLRNIEDEKRNPHRGQGRPGPAAGPDEFHQNVSLKASCQRRHKCHLSSFVSSRRLRRWLNPAKTVRRMASSLGGNGAMSFQQNFTRGFHFFLLQQLAQRRLA